VLSTNGDTFLGGEDFDKRIIDFIADEFRKEQGIDVRNDPLAMQRLKRGRREGQDRAQLQPADRRQLPYITADASGPKHLNVKLTRSKLEALVDDLVQKTLEPCRIALTDAGLKASDLQDVILVAARPACPRCRSR